MFEPLTSLARSGSFPFPSAKLQPQLSQNKHFPSG